MKLSKEDIDLFYRLYHPLLVYVNKKLDIKKEINSPEDFKKFPVTEINKFREGLYSQPDLIDAFVTENSLNFSTGELEIISSWKNFVKGTFYIFRYMKNHTVFLSSENPPKAYGVLALNTPFNEMAGQYLPVMVNAVLLPFKDKIIYDSMFSPHSISFGSGIRRSLNDDYQQAKSKFGIITSLPFSGEKVEQDDADKLRFYLKSERNRNMYWEEITELMEKNTDFLTLYHQEMGKFHARSYGRRLRKIGLSNVWFAIFRGITIASGVTRDEVERILQSILPPEEKKFVYIFKLKK